MSQADAYALASPARHTRTYSLDGLPEREALVFKSMVRLLGHRTKDAWSYSPSSAELHVVADNMSVFALQSTLARQVLTLGVGNVKRQSYLRLPLHANELEAELNRLGALIFPMDGACSTLPEIPFETMPMRMVRWPPAGLLTTTTRVRLATLMAGKPLTLGELQQRSKENLATCTAFFADLRQSNLLTPVAALAASKAAQLQTSKKPVQPGLLTRIRMRLGLSTSGASGQTSRA